MSWSKECVISEAWLTPRIPANPDGNPPVQEVAAIQKTWATFQINNAKLYVAAVTLSDGEDDKELILRYGWPAKGV